MDAICRAKQALSDALHAGFGVKDIHERAEMIRDIETVEAYSKHNGTGEMDYSEWLLTRIESELKAAQDYCDKWLETKEAVYKQIALDELKHSDMIVNVARQKLTASEYRAKLQELHAWRERIVKLLE